MLLMNMLKESTYLPEYKSVISLPFCDANVFVGCVGRVCSLQLLLEGKNCALKCNTLCTVLYLVTGECQNFFSKISIQLLTEKGQAQPKPNPSTWWGYVDCPTPLPDYKVQLPHPL